MFEMLILLVVVLIMLGQLLPESHPRQKPSKRPATSNRPHTARGKTEQPCRNNSDRAAVNPLQKRINFQL